MDEGFGNSSDPATASLFAASRHGIFGPRSFVGVYKPRKTQRGDWLKFNRTPFVQPTQSGQCSPLPPVSLRKMVPAAQKREQVSPG
jgi:hypothetical protein